MYFYLPNQRYGNDKVAQIAGENFSLGGLYEVDGERGVCLGDEIAFSELARPYRRDGQSPDSIHLIVDTLVGPKSLQMIHRFVQHRYTSYHKSLPLRLGDLDQLLKRKKQGRRKKGGRWSVEEKRIQNTEYRVQKSDSFQSQSKTLEGATSSSLTYRPVPTNRGQTLLVFPTVWSMHQYLQGWLMDLAGSIVLHGQRTAASRAQAYWAIKSGAVHTIYATYSQIYREYDQLSHIILIDQHAWWYKNFQEPRYFVPSVIDQLQHIRGCDVTKTGVMI